MYFWSLLFLLYQEDRDIFNIIEYFSCCNIKIDAVIVGRFNFIFPGFTLI